ncbi:hypothetical protein ER308_15500 [Egibacter rhizosphaerae]|uniref:Transposase n=1 Tax=Egibacter rhizosphaerae TaxID=1670831 RepID=A0A411YIC1_9ACTN|nr:hypothetical protein [Egibacter rhizosphaerae]QBI20836.1 hypothetical protein ER308_15500 [Egibacter rhizosphaerae]
MRGPRSYCGAAELAGCDQHTVKRYVQRRDAGLSPETGVVRASMIDGFRPKIAELVARSKGKIRADVVHDKLTAMGFAGTDRTTRRAVAAAKKACGSSIGRTPSPRADLRRP